VEGASGPILILNRVRDAVLGDLQIRGGVKMTGVENVTLSASRFDQLELREAGEGKSVSRLRGIPPDKIFKFDGVNVDVQKAP
jgi:hypothetical protein